MVECFESGDDAVEAGLDVAEVVGESELAVGVGAGDQPPIGVGLVAVDVEELGGGLEVGACEAGIGVRAVLLWWPSAVAVGQAVADPGKVVFDSFGVGGDGVGVVVEVVAGDVDSLTAELLAAERRISPLSITEIPQVLRRGGEPVLSVGQVVVITSCSSSSLIAIGSEQLGQWPPMPTRRMKVTQSAQRCSPTARAPQVSHS